MSHIKIPAARSNYAPIEYMPACYPGQADVDVSAGLLQGRAVAPSIVMQLYGREPSVLVGRPDYSSSDKVVSDLLVGMLLRSRGDSGIVIVRGTDADAGGI